MFNKLRESIKSTKGNKCKFRKECKHYRKNSYTCNASVDKAYCGAYKKLDKPKELVR